MHARQRNLGNGYRSGSIGMGMSASRISPDRPMRGHGFYGSDHQHRGFNRGYGRGRGRSKSYHNQLPPPLPPPPVQRRSGGGGGDVFMEAGRLATEYLVSQGVLPQTVLSGKWQNGNFRKQAGEFQSSRSQEAARMDASAPTSDKRRYIDGYSSAGSRNSLKGRRSNRYDSDFGRSGSWSERSKAFEADTGDNSVSGHQEEQPLAEDIASSVQRSASGEFMRKREGAGDSESVLDKYNLQDEAQSKTGSSSAGKDIVHDCEISKVSEGSSSMSAGSGEMKGRSAGNNGENENHTAIEDGSIHQRCEDASIDQRCGADESFTKSDVDLAALCKFEKVPTRTRSSLTAKGPKLYLSQNIKETTHNSGLLEENQTKNRCETQDLSSGKADSTGDDNINDRVEDLALVQFVENSKCHRSNSFPNSSLRDNIEKDSGLELPNLHRSHSVGKVGEKRDAEDSELEETAKRQRDWVPLPVSEANERFNVFKTSETQCKSEEEEQISTFNKRLIDAAKRVSNRTHTGKTGPGYAEEHQLFPASFKICDLNLGGASDVNDGKRESGKAVDFDLSISNSSKSLEFSTNTRMSNGKEIEVIDLDDDSPEVVKSSNDPGRKQEAAPYMGINDVPDYNEGLMMVEFLDSFGNIPPINPGTSSVPQNNNAVGLQDREGAIGNDQVPSNTDDDSIFMSLGEIPLTFLQAWDQPPARGYEKPF
ncbi:hypothetical protein CARUB_v10004258mg [Capsella rubella]|uniref:Uncharacterized protein n=1 Tax=Capsella rubella TaxID=81985 RepID=R0F409_9BRAS|nr:uncharacterized protein At4g26450 [Capsella rubella]EOA16125.1 hypothetical protein CARUB_v10004258mg [Capsella rubella]EOA16126.1 hypothetical protein CARUB_v10004258mg [Capsella rubella]